MNDKVLKMSIENVKGINQLEFIFPLQPGIYAITGENGSGKSTLISCASSVFYQMPMIDFFGRPDNAAIEFSLDDCTRSWKCDGKKWIKITSDKRMRINGFYEGSIIFGNRFKDTDFSTIKKLDELGNDDILPAKEFIYKNMGRILKNDEGYYKGLYIVKKDKANSLGLRGEAFCLRKGNNQLISQPRMSTGENLLLSILRSLEYVQKKRISNSDGRPCIVFLDEIELALHSSALRRLIIFLKEISKDLELSIFFSTHSIDLLREIKSQNIYYLDSYEEESIIITNPCYPAYATRNLYGDDGYGNDIVILVEDDLAKLIIEKLMYKKHFIKNIRIKILPTGGWANTIKMAYDITTSNLLQKGTKLAVILDRDIKDEVPKFIKSHKQYSGIKPDYLPIESLEKYLYSKLIIKLDKALFDELDTYLFQKRPLSEILKEAKKSINQNSDDNKDKTFYGLLIQEVRSMKKEREEIIDIVVRYVIENENCVEEVSQYIIDKVNA